MAYQNPNPQPYVGGQDSPQRPQLPFKPQPTFLEAIKMGWERRNEFGTRSRRAEYWWFYLFMALCTTIVSQIAGFFGIITQLISTMVISVPLYWPMLAVMSRRLHDSGHSSKWMWVLFALSIALLMCYVPILSDIDSFTAGNIEVIEDHMTSLICAGILFIPTLILGLINLVFCLQDSKREPNKWGKSPKYNY